MYLRWVALLGLAAACATRGSEPPPPSPTPLASPAAPSANAAPPQPTAPAAPAARDAPAPNAKPAPDLSEVDRLIAEGIDAGKLPGAVVLIGRRDGVIAQRAYGRRAIEPAPEAMTLDTIFDLASLTKPLVTATLVLQLVEQGKLDLDDRIAKHVPALRRRATRAITVRQLLVHGAGLPRVNKLRDYDDGPELGLKRLLAVDPTATPGSTHLYSDLSYLWLGQLVTRLTGKPLDVLARERIFAPLTMKDTDFGVSAAKRARTAPTELRDDVPIRGDVHDPRAFRLGGVAGNAGVFSTAADLARYARMLLHGGTFEGARVLAPESVRAMGRPQRIGEALRTAGWDVDSPYSGLRGKLLSERAFGHGGFTGVSLWIDPERDLFVIFLSNRVHPDGKGNVIRLVGAVTDAIVRALDALPDPCEAQGPVRVGIDVLRERGFAPLAGKRVALLTHDAARAADGRRSVDVLHEAPSVQLVSLLGPEHGLGGDREGPQDDGVDNATGLPVHSLFGRIRRPTAKMLNGAEVIAIDLVDVGARFYTYASTVRQVLAAAAELNLSVVLLDRPNPLGGIAVEGPVLDDDRESFVNYHPLAVRHGMTLGELAALVNAERALAARLHVVPVEGWRRDQRFAATGLTWHPPSPNLPTAASALRYPAIGLLESTNVAVGRGTDMPFAVVAAPWIDAKALHRKLRAARLPGVQFSPIELTPKARPYRGERCHGVRLKVTDPDHFEPVRTGLEVARQLRALHREAFEAEDLIKMVGSRAVTHALLNGASTRRLERIGAPRLQAFRERRALFLRYPSCQSGS
jgi:uncharacterized protein YbbC (DUF1343 family)